jgi:hypothetical protein
VLLVIIIPTAKMMVVTYCSYSVMPAPHSMKDVAVQTVRKNCTCHQTNNVPAVQAGKMVR